MKQPTILITGASGFVGNHLVKAFVEDNKSVITFSQHAIKRTSFIGKEKKILSEIRQEKGFIEDSKKVFSVVKRNKIDYIIHLAAQPIVEIGTQTPLPTFQTNIQGTWNVLEAARLYGVKKVIIASTTHIYGNNPHLPYKENYYPQPSRPYETSKACVDLLSQCFADTYGLTIEIPRFVNIYGPGDFNFSRLIPKVIQSILQGESPHVWDVGAVRDFLYIDDVVAAYKALLDNKRHDKENIQIFNFGSGEPVKVLYVAQKLITLSKDKKMKVLKRKVPHNREQEIRRQYISIAKAKRTFGWYPKTSLKEGLEKTFFWYKDYFAKHR